MSGNLEAFLSESTIAKRVRAKSRVVVRRFDASPRDVGAALDSGRIEIEAKPVCELLVGGTLVARGEVITEDGISRFHVTEVVG